MSKQPPQQVLVMPRELKPGAANLVGQRFGRLIVVRPVTANRRAHWLCRCDCGNDSIAQSSSLTDGRTNSCGCGQGFYVHGGSRSKAYRTWAGMIQRCTNPKSPVFDHYGGRGIMVCDRWQLFANFHTDMGDRPHGKTLDRIDSNGHYEPSNCRWATIKEQTRNRGNNRLITFQGRTMPAISWAEEIGVHKNTLYSRLRRMSDEDALTLKLIKGAKAWKPPKLG